MHRLALVSVLCLAAAVAACGGGEDDQPPVATPGFASDRTRAPLGSPLELTYTFEVAPDATLGGDYHVFVHFLDRDGELMWTDDHRPTPPTTDWKGGQKISYSRTMFVPVYPYVGEAQVRMGLYSLADGRRLPLNAKEVGDREYEVGAITLAPQSENVFLILKEGWHAAESAPDQPAVEWQWTRKTASVAFRNPRRDVMLYLEADGRPDLFDPPQEVSISVNGTPAQTFTMTDKVPTIRRVPISAAQLGDQEMVEMSLDADRTFVPAQIPPGQPGHGTDTRELGIRVYHLFVAPR